MLETPSKSWQDAAIAAISDGIWLLDPEGRIIQSNGKFEHLLGIRTEDVLGQYCYQTVHCTSDFFEGCPLQRMKQTGMRELAELEDKERGVWLQVIVDPIRDESGGIRGGVHIVRDITERKRAEEEVHLLQTLTLAIGESQDLDAALRAVLQEVCNTTGWVYGEAWIPRPDGTVLERRSAWYSAGGLEEFSALTEGFTFPPGKGLPGRVWSSKEPVWMRDATVDPEFLRASSARDAGLKTGVGIPVLAQDEVVAVIAFFTFKACEEDRRFVRLVSSVAAQLGSFIRSKRIEELLRRRCDELAVRSHIIGTILQTHNLDEQLNLILDEVMRPLDAEMGGIYLLEPEAVVLRVWRGVGEEFLTQVRRFPADSPPDWMTTPRVLHERLDEKGEIPDVAKREGIQAAAYLPLKITRRSTGGMEQGKEWLGTMVLSSYRYDALSQQDVDTLQPLAESLTIAIVNSSLLADLRQAEQRYHSIFENAVEGIFQSTPDGRLLTANPALARIAGYESPEELIRDITDIRRQVYVDPECRLELIRLLEERGVVQGFEYRGYRKDRSVVWASLNARAVRDASGALLYYEGTTQDITERKRAEEALHQQLTRIDLLNQIARAMAQRHDMESIFRAVLGHLEEHLPIAMGSVLLFDPQTETLTVAALGTKSQQLGGELGILEGMVIPVEHTVFGTGAKGEVVYQPDIAQTDRPIPQKLAQAGIRSTLVAPLEVEGKIMGVLFVGRHEVHGFSSAECEFMRVLGEQVALAAFQAQLYRDLQKAYDDLRETQERNMQQQRLRALGEMASGIAHDINNMLSPIVSFTDLLLMSEQNLSERAKQYLKDIRAAGTDIVHIVGRMRDFYRKREEREPLHPVNLNHLARQVLDLTRPRWKDIPQEYGSVVEMLTELDPDLPLITGIESEIREALINLILNALDAIPQGGTVTVRTWVGEYGTLAAPHAFLGVTDTGVGMDAETCQRCLEPFFSTKGEQGTGLGLAQVYGMMQRHEGAMDIESAPGQGTTMRLIFPLREFAEATGSARPKATVPRPLRILCIDDEPLMRNVLREILENDGHAVEIADGGQEGLEAFRAAKKRGEPFDVLITDLGMPSIDGRKVARTVKREWPTTPVILLTGWVMRRKGVDEMPAFVDYVLSKPPNMNDLRGALMKVAQSSVTSHEASIRFEAPTGFESRGKKRASMKRKRHILIAEDDQRLREFLDDLLANLGFSVTVARDGREALDLVEGCHDLVLTDVKMPRLDGIGLLKALNERRARPSVIVMTAYATIESAVEATKAGADGYLAKPFKPDALLDLIDQVLEARRGQRASRLLQRELEQSYRFHGLIGKSRKMTELFLLMEGIAESQSTVLLQGESGTGKELMARALHSMSPRKENPFVALNCGGLAETLLESELFGHTRGAFTGAITEKKGLFRTAHGGTLFLDEIGETPPSMQVKLLRILEEGEIRPVGGTCSIPVDVRFIAATNRDLEEAVHSGTFRADLFYRLNVISLVLPPLRERIEDIPLLVEHLLARHNARLKKRVGEVSPEAMACLLAHPWPGNVRELDNCLLRAVILSKGELILPEVLPPQVRFQGKGAQHGETQGTLEKLTQQAIVEALTQAKGNRRLASLILGISESTLYRKLKALEAPEENLAT